MVDEWRKMGAFVEARIDQQEEQSGHEGGVRRNQREIDRERPLGYLCISRLLCAFQLHVED